MKILILSILLVSTFVQAQNTRLFGKVFDKTTGETLIGANVMVDGTSLGSATDLEGAYEIQLKAGLYSIRVSYVSYIDKKINNVMLLENETKELNINLSPEEMSSDEIVVEAKILDSEESGLLVAQKKSTKTFDAISSEQISKSSDNNIAAALKRVTGVTIVGNKNLYVRGLGDRYSNIQLNGALLPSTNPDKKEVPVDIFSSSLIDNIIVQKTYTADQPGEFSGGSVQIKTKDFPENKVFGISVSTDFNSMSSFKEGLSYNGGNIDFLGFDDGHRALPTELKNKELKGSLEKDQSMASKFNGTFTPKKTNVLPSESISLNFADQFKIGEESFGLSSSISYSFANSLKQTVENNLESSNGSSSGDQSRYSFNNETGTKNTSINSIINLFYKINSNNKIGIKNLYSHSSEDQAKIIEGIDYEDDYTNKVDVTYIKQTLLKYVQTSVFSTNLSYEGFSENLYQAKYIMDVSFANALRYEPDTRRTLSYYDANSSDKTYRFNLSNKNNLHFFLDQNDNNFNTKANVQFKFFPDFKFQAGYDLYFKSRTFNARRFEYVVDYGSNNYPNEKLNKSAEEAFSPDLIGNGLLLTETSGENDGFKANQQIYAGFINLDYVVNENISMQFGLRAENSTQKINSSVINDNVDFLPAFNSTFKLDDQNNLRIAYSQTLARPEFRELSRFLFTDYVGGKSVNGKPDLEQTQISNLDFRYEIFPNINELVAVSSFYKKFTNPVEIVYVSDNNNVQYKNAQNAILYGFEVEMRKTFTSDFSINGNYSYIFSTVKYSNYDGNSQANSDRPLFGQSPYTINFNLFYQPSEESYSFNLGFNRFGKRLVAVGNNSQLADEYEMPFNKIDLTSSYSYEDYKFKLSIQNVLNESIINKQNSIETLNYKPGVSYKLGLSYNFK